MRPPLRCKRREAAMSEVSGTAPPQPVSSFQPALRRGRPISGTGGAGGSTLRPLYGERRPVMYHVFESEMKSISSLNAQALAWISAGSFCLSIAANICVSSIFATQPLSDAATLVVRYGLTAAIGLSVICYFFGGWAILRRRSTVKQIEDETRSNAI
jgi:hypothetical protein